MTGSISRKLYQQLLLLHPEPFRREFGDEMVSIFDECRKAQGPWRLFADVVLSAGKQQFHYLAIPAPKRAPIYSEIATSLNLARILATAVFSVALIASVLVGRKPETPESGTAVLPEALFWFPTVAWGQYCLDTSKHTGRLASVPITRVLVARKRKAPQDYRVVRSETRLWFPTVSAKHYCSNAD